MPHARPAVALPPSRCRRRGVVVSPGPGLARARLPMPTTRRPWTELLGEAARRRRAVHRARQVEVACRLQLRSASALRTLFANARRRHAARIAQLDEAQPAPPATSPRSAPTQCWRSPSRTRPRQPRSAALPGTRRAGRGHLAEAFGGYFRQSEQLPTRLLLVCDGRRAAGLMLQKLPGRRRRRRRLEPRRHPVRHLREPELLAVGCRTSCAACSTRNPGMAGRQAAALRVLLLARPGRGDAGLAGPRGSRCRGRGRRRRGPGPLRVLRPAGTASMLPPSPSCSTTPPARCRPPPGCNDPPDAGSVTGSALLIINPLIYGSESPELRRRWPVHPPACRSVTRPLPLPCSPGLRQPVARTRRPRPPKRDATVVPVLNKGKRQAGSGAAAGTSDHRYRRWRTLALRQHHARGHLRPAGRRTRWPCCATATTASPARSVGSPAIACCRLDGDNKPGASERQPPRHRRASSPQPPQRRQGRRRGRQRSHDDAGLAVAEPVRSEGRHQRFLAVRGKSIGREGFVSVGGTVARARLVPATDAPRLADDRNTRSLRRGRRLRRIRREHRRPGSSTSPGESEVFKGLGLGLTWRTPVERRTHRRRRQRGHQRPQPVLHHHREGRRGRPCPTCATSKTCLSFFLFWFAAAKGRIPDAALSSFGACLRTIAGGRRRRKSQADFALTVAIALVESNRGRSLRAGSSRPAPTGRR